MFFQIFRWSRDGLPLIDQFRYALREGGRCVIPAGIGKVPSYARTLCSILFGLMVPPRDSTG